MPLPGSYNSHRRLDVIAQATMLPGGSVTLPYDMVTNSVKNKKNLTSS